MSHNQLLPPEDRKVTEVLSQIEYAHDMNNPTNVTRYITVTVVSKNLCDHANLVKRYRPETENLKLSHVVVWRETSKTVKGLDDEFASLSTDITPYVLKTKFAMEYMKGNTQTITPEVFYTFLSDCVKDLAKNKFDMPYFMANAKIGAEVNEEEFIPSTTLEQAVNQLQPENRPLFGEDDNNDEFNKVSGLPTRGDIKALMAKTGARHVIIEDGKVQNAKDLPKEMVEMAEKLAGVIKPYQESLQNHKIKDAESKLKPLQEDIPISPDMMFNDLLAKHTPEDIKDLLAKPKTLTKLYEMYGNQKVDAFIEIVNEKIKNNQNNKTSHVNEQETEGEAESSVQAGPDVH